MNTGFCRRRGRETAARKKDERVVLFFHERESGEGVRRESEEGEAAIDVKL